VNADVLFYLYLFFHSELLCGTNVCLFQKEQSKTEQICEMASVMSKAIQIDDLTIQEEEERLAALEFENQGLRELLQISGVTRSDFEEFQKERERQRGSTTPTMSD
jgi:hypothetical protein